MLKKLLILLLLFENISIPFFVILKFNFCYNTDDFVQLDHVDYRAKARI